MKTMLILAALTAVNVGALALSLGQTHAAAASTDQILRGRGLEIVDAAGRVRASVQIVAPMRQPDGTRSEETVLLRLITEKGRPSVKIATSERQSALSLAGPSGTRNSYVLARAGASTSSLVVRNEDGSERVLAPE